MRSQNPWRIYQAVFSNLAVLTNTAGIRSTLQPPHLCSYSSSSPKSTGPSHALLSRPTKNALTPGSLSYFFLHKAVFFPSELLLVSLKFSLHIASSDLAKRKPITPFTYVPEHPPTPAFRKQNQLQAILVQTIPVFLAPSPMISLQLYKTTLNSPKILCYFVTPSLYTLFPLPQDPLSS